MPTGLVSWSQTANTNATADSNVNYAEGQAPSSLNDSASRAHGFRSQMARRHHRRQCHGRLRNGLHAFEQSTLWLQHDRLHHSIHARFSTNTGAVTLSIDSNTAQPLRFLTGVDLPSGVLISGSLYQATYRSASSEWLLHASPLATPFLDSDRRYRGLYRHDCTKLEFRAFRRAGDFDRTTYATLFALIGTTFGIGEWFDHVQRPRYGGPRRRYA